MWREFCLSVTIIYKHFMKNSFYRNAVQSPSSMGQASIVCDNKTRQNVGFVPPCVFLLLFELRKWPKYQKCCKIAEVLEFWYYFWTFFTFAIARAQNLKNKISKHSQTWPISKTIISHNILGIKRTCWVQILVLQI